MTSASAGTVVQVAGTRDIKVPEWKCFSRNCCSSGGNMRILGAIEEMVSA
jgi:hypothetical protein